MKSCDVTIHMKPLCHSFHVVTLVFSISQAIILLFDVVCSGFPSPSSWADVERCWKSSSSGHETKKTATIIWGKNKNM